MAVDFSISPSSRILLVQLGDIGDVVLTTPTIRAFKETLSECRVSILVRKPCGALLANDPHLQEVIELEESLRFIQRLRAARYDLVVDLRTGDRGALLSWLSGARQRVGYHVGGKQFWHDLLFTTVIRKLHIAPPPVHPGADQSLRLVREIGIDTTDSTPRLYLSAKDKEKADALLAVCRSPRITINPFARWQYKEWNNTKWAQLIERLRIPVVLIGSAEEAKRAGTFPEHVLNLAGKTTLGELAAVLAQSALHIGVDSAAPHIAAAVGTPTLTIHGPTEWRGWRLVNERHQVVTPNDKMLAHLEVEPVLAAATEMLRRLNALP
jgi:heptosyltransferase-3